MPLLSGGRGLGTGSAGTGNRTPFRGGIATFSEDPGRGLRLRDMLAPSRESSSTAAGAEASGLRCAAHDKGANVGEYVRDAGAGENDETCRRMTNSSVAFVRVTILLRREDETAWELPCVLIAFDN